MKQQKTVSSGFLVEIGVAQERPEAIGNALAGLSLRGAAANRFVRAKLKRRRRASGAYYPIVLRRADFHY